MAEQGFSDACLRLPDSITHGTKARIEEMNRHASPDAQVLDLSIGTLDLPADPRIDEGVCAFIRHNAETIHAFAPVKGLPFLRKSLAAKIKRLHGVEVDPETEVIVTPGGIKGALTVLFHTFINPGDEVVIPVPNWPHYADMLCLHRATPRFVPARRPHEGLTARDLEAHITDKTKLLLLGDCINPTGKIYTSDELRRLAQVVAVHNVRRALEKKSPIQVLFDCPYEAHVLGRRAVTFAMIEVDVPGHGRYSLRQCTSTLTGPGKTYGMHGDRIGYVWAPPSTIAMAARVQVNTNSFASTYGQVATHLAVQEAMDEVLLQRARHARANLERVLHRLSSIGSLNIASPDGGYFLFVDFSKHAESYGRLGYQRADQFLLQEARVATISGSSFAQGPDHLRHFVRINCGRSIGLLEEACARIEKAVSRLDPARVHARELQAEGHFPRSAVQGADISECR
jgi:aspartate aminotransferase